MREKADRAAAELEVQHQEMHERTKKGREDRLRKEQEKLAQVAREKQEQEILLWQEEKRRAGEKEAEKQRKVNALAGLMQKQRGADVAAEQRWLRHQIETGILKVALNSSKVWVAFPVDAMPDSKGTPIDTDTHKELISELSGKMEEEAKALAAVVAPPPARKLQVRTSDMPWMRQNAEPEPRQPEPVNLANLIISPKKALKGILEATKTAKPVEQQQAARPAPQRFASLARQEDGAGGDDMQGSGTSKARGIAAELERRSSVSATALAASSHHNPRTPSVVASTLRSPPAAAVANPALVAAAQDLLYGNDAGPNPASAKAVSSPVYTKFKAAVVPAPVAEEPLLYGDDSRAPAEAAAANPFIYGNDSGDAAVTRAVRPPMQDIYGDEQPAPQHPAPTGQDTIYGNDQRRAQMEEIYGDELTARREPMQEIYGDEQTARREPMQEIYGNSEGAAAPEPARAAPQAQAESEFIYSNTSAPLKRGSTSATVAQEDLIYGDEAGAKGPAVVISQQALYNTIGD